jgi:prephenate dehydrogenase
MSHTAIVGLGLIGGSLAHALRRGGKTVRVADIDRASVTAARRDGLVAEVADADGLRAAVRGAESVVIAVPLERMADVARAVIEAAPGDAKIFHTAGLQRATAVGLSSELAERVFGTHPIAGSHRAGYAAADPALFTGATVSVESRARLGTRGCAESLWLGAGAARIVFRSADEHDRIVAWVSHLPQLVSTALGATLDHAHIDPRESGPGARDTTRLAASPLATWSAVLRAAPPDTLRALEAMQSTLAELRAAVAAPDPDALAELWTAAQRWATARADR